MFRGNTWLVNTLLDRVERIFTVTEIALHSTVLEHFFIFKYLETYTQTDGTVPWM